mgnify:CR=1 FL=1
MAGRLSSDPFSNRIHVLNHGEWIRQLLWAHGNGVVAQDAGNFLLPVGPCDIVIVHHHVLFYHFLFGLKN